MGIFDFFKDKKDKNKKETKKQSPYYHGFRNDSQTSKPVSQPTSKTSTKTTSTEPVTPHYKSYEEFRKTFTSEPMLRNKKEKYENYFRDKGDLLTSTDIRMLNLEMQENFAITDEMDRRFIKAILLETWGLINFRGLYKDAYALSKTPYIEFIDNASYNFRKNKVLTPLEVAFISKRVIFPIPLDSPNDPRCQTVINNTPYQVLIIEQSFPIQTSAKNVSRVNYEIRRFDDPRYDMTTKVKIKNAIENAPTKRVRQGVQNRDLYIQ